MSEVRFLTAHQQHNQAIQRHSRCSGKYRKIHKLKIHKIRKLNTTQKSKQRKNTVKPWFSRLWRHSAKKRCGLILQRSRAHTGM